MSRANSRPRELLDYFNGLTEDDLEPSPDELKALQVVVRYVAKPCPMGCDPVDMALDDEGQVLFMMGRAYERLVNPEGVSVNKSANGVSKQATGGFH